MRQGAKIFEGMKIGMLVPGGKSLPLGHLDVDLRL